MRDDEDEPLLSLGDEYSERQSSAPVSVIALDPTLCSIFVVAFDTRCGNIVEWCYPSSFDISGAEFKALPSGAHNVQHDVMLFEMNGHYGLATYIMRQVDNASERGARMKSVGIVCKHYLSLAAHEDKLFDFAHQSVERYNGKGNNQSIFYEELIEYFTTHNATAIPRPTEIRPPEGSLYELLKSQGPDLFLLWKMMLLNKRIIIQCTPPITRQCSYVQGLAMLLGNIPQNKTNPLFYITVNDITTLKLREAYIACTADLVLKSKGVQLFDVFVTGSALHNDTGMVMSCTRGDRLRHGILSNMINHHAANKNSLELDEMILSYFASLTCDLFTALDSAHNHQTFSAKDLQDLRLHVTDLPFLQVLIDKMGYDIELFEPGCCEDAFKSLL